MSENFGKTVVLFIAIFLGILLFVYIGIPLLKLLVSVLLVIIGGIAALVGGIVRVVVFLVLLVASIIGIVTFFLWLFERKQIE